MRPTGSTTSRDTTMRPEAASEAALKRSIRAQAEERGVPPDLVERLLGSACYEPATGCLNWTRALTADGYASLRWTGKVIYGHHAAFQIGHGELPPGHRVRRHLCGNRRCINPSHLTSGTQVDNAADAKRHGTLRGRWRRYLSGREIGEVRGLLLLGHSAPQIRKDMNFSLWTIQQVKAGRAGKRGDDEFNAAVDELQGLTGVAGL